MILCIGTTPALQRVMVFDRFVPDAVNRAGTTLDGLGGKALNVAKVLAMLRSDPLAVGFAGGRRGTWLEAEMRRRGVACEFIDVSAETRLCTTIIDRQTGQITELVEESAPVTAEDYERLHALVTKLLPGAQAVVLSGTLAPGGPPNFYARCLEAARGLGVLTVVDAQGDALTSTLQGGPDVIKPNRTELARTLGRTPNTDEELWNAMDLLLKKGARGIVVTHGPKQILASTGDRKWRIIPPQVSPVNPIGSGDSFTAAMVHELVRKQDLGEACRAGAAAGAANALTLLPGEVRQEEFDKLVREVQVEVIKA